jgi:hypothetical protein
LGDRRAPTRKAWQPLRSARLQKGKARSVMLRAFMWCAAPVPICLATLPPCTGVPMSMNAYCLPASG